MSAGAPSASDAIGLSRANLVRAIRLPRSGTASGVIPEHWRSRVAESGRPERSESFLWLREFQSIVVTLKVNGLWIYIVCDRRECP